MRAVPHLKFSNGAEMPAIGFGTWKSKPGEVEAAVAAAIDVGYRHIDCALAYLNEKEVGKAIKNKIEGGSVTRDQLFITTKLWNTYHRPDLVEKGIHESLDSLGLEYIDLYLIHWPMGYKEDTDMFPKDENGQLIYSDVDFIDTWRAMEKLVEQGLAKSIGLSNFNTEQIQRILDLSDLKHKPVNLQVEIHPYMSNSKLLEWCEKRNITVTAYSPLGSPDRPWATPGEPKLVDDPSLVEIAQKYKKSPAQIILRWGLERGYAVIPKSVTLSRIKENFQIFDFSLMEEEMNILYKMNKDYRACHLNWDSSHPYFPFKAEY